MATFSSVQRQHVLTAIEEYDQRGEEDFCAVYGFEPQPGYALTHAGQRYDARALLGVAHRVATGRLATQDDFHGDMTDAVALLRRRGFEVSAPVAARRTRPAPTRVPRAAGHRSPRASRAPEAAPKICPTCFTALPATGVCDTCG